MLSVDPEKLRRARGTTPKEVVALRVGRGWTTITAYERGDVTPSARVLLAMAALYGVTVESLCTEVAPEPVSAS